MTRTVTTRCLGGMIVVALALILARSAKSPSASSPAGGGGDTPVPERAPRAEALLAQYYPVPPSTPNTPSKYQRIAATANGFEPPANMQKLIDNPGSRWKNPAKAVQPVFPKNFSGPVRVRCASADVSAVPLNANPQSSGEIAADGSLIYRDAFGPGIDVAYRCEAIKTEEFIIIRDVARASACEAAAVLPLSSEERGPGGEVRAVTQFSWDLHCGGLKPRLTPGHTIEFCDTQGVPRLRINAPEGKDANGKPLAPGKQLKLSLEGERLTLACDLRDAKFPVVIDPSWSTTGAMGVGREQCTATKLDNGKVLVTGGFGTNFYEKTCEIFDPTSDTWQSVTDLGTARWYHTATLLENGKVLVAGGEIQGGPPVVVTSSCEIYDPAGNAWTAAAPLQSARSVHSAERLANGNVLVISGYDPGAGPHLTSCEIYNPAGNSWTATGPLSATRPGFSSVVLQNGKVLVTGGNIAASAEVYDPASGTWNAADAPQHSRLGQSLVKLADGKILLTGGSNSSYVHYRESEIYDPILNDWSTTGDLVQGRSFASLSILKSGYGLLMGGQSTSDLQSCEAFVPANSQWRLTKDLRTARSNGLSVVLNDDRVLYFGGNLLGSCEVLDPRSIAIPQSVSVHKGQSIEINLTSDALSDAVSWTIASQPQHGVLAGVTPNITYTSSFHFSGSDSFSFYGTDEFGVGTSATVMISVTNTAPQSSDQSVFTHWGTAKSITLGGTDADNDALTYSVVAQPQHGTVSGTAPNLTYTPSGTFTGADSFTFKVNDGVADSAAATVSINVTNTAPTVQAAASPLSVVPNQAVTFTSEGTDPDGDALTYLWDFGDGATSTDQNATHAYAAVGSYTATVTVSDAAGGTANATVIIQVSEAPTARVTTSDVVAFGNQPFTFDASTSTDPENAIVSYVWNFGDGTPSGSGQVISKIYKEPGTYTVTLTITDAAGVTTTVSRIIEVLPADQAGLYNGFVDYKVGWNRGADNKDSLTLNASVNVGDDVIAKDTTLALEIAGVRFTGKLDTKLRDYTNVNAKWTVKTAIRKQPAGTVTVSLKVKNASLGAGFNQLGVLSNGDPSDVIEKDIPVRLEIGPRTFEVLVPSEFKFDASGKKAKGTGDS